MYKLLIVDDERYAVDGLAASQDWAALSFEPPLRAYSARQAKAILDGERVDILLCDIEMPGESGLELIAWLRAAHPEILPVIVTCHEKFDYAVDALRLGALDYIVKPIFPEKLRSVLAGAAERLESSPAQEEVQRLQCRHYWQEYLRRSSGDILRFEKHHVPYTMRTLFLPILVHAKRLRERGASAAQLTEEAARRALEGLDAPRAGECSFPYDNERCGLILCDRGGERLPEAGLALLRRIVREEKPRGEVAFYLGDPVGILGVRAAFAALAQRDEDNIAAAGGVYSPGSAAKPASIHSEAMREWGPLLVQGQTEELAARIRASLNDLRSAHTGGMPALESWREDFLQMVYAALASASIQAHALGQDGEGAVGQPDSLDDMERYACAVVARAARLMEEAAGADQVGRQIARYIDEHLDEELSRAELAGLFHVHQDTLSRLFKRAHALSLSEYITARRIARAQLLLTNTALSITQIADMTGFRQVSHFSDRFKKRVGMTPMQYRKSRKGPSPAP